MAMNGKFVWYELMTSDTAGALQFYADVLGLESKILEMVGPPYTLLYAGPTGVGGVYVIPESLATVGAKPSWTGYISVDDVDAYSSLVINSGGKIITGGEDIPGVGRWATASDPTGSVFILFTPSRDAPQPDPTATRMGTVGWHELHAGSLEMDLAFYKTVFGYTEGEAHDMGPMGVYQLFDLDGVPQGGIMTRPAGSQVSGWLYYFVTDAAGAAAKRVEMAGGKICVPPHEVPGGGWIVQCTDPQGAAFAMMASVN